VTWICSWISNSKELDLPQFWICLLGLILYLTVTNCLKLQWYSEGRFEWLCTCLNDWIVNYYCGLSMTTLDTHSFMKVDLFYFFSKWGILNEEIVLEIVIHTIVKIILQLRTRRKFFPRFLHIKWNGIPLKLFSKKLPSDANCW